MPAFSLALVFCTILLTAPVFAQSVPPAGYGQPSGEYDITLSRVPIPQRPAAKALKPPFEPSPGGRWFFSTKSSRSFWDAAPAFNAMDRKARAMEGPPRFCLSSREISPTRSSTRCERQAR